MLDLRELTGAAEMSDLRYRSPEPSELLYLSNCVYIEDLIRGTHNILYS
jgi:hypothetical protein